MFNGGVAVRIRALFKLCSMTYKIFKKLYDKLALYMLNNEWIFSNQDLIKDGLHVSIEQAVVIEKNYAQFSRDEINQEVFLFHIIYMKFPNVVYENEKGVKMRINIPRNKTKSPEKGILKVFKFCKHDEGIYQLYQHMKSGFYD